MPADDTRVSETVVGAARKGELPNRKVVATATIVRQLLEPIQGDLRRPRDRALILVGFTDAQRRAELTAIRVEYLEIRERGLRLTLPRSKGERAGCHVALPYGATELCPMRALRCWQEAAGITAGAVFRRIFVPPRGRDGRQAPSPWLASPGTVARIVQARAAAAGFDRGALGGYGLKRGALTTGMDRGVHPTRLKQLGRHKSYAVPDEYLELGDPFESHPLNGVL